MHAAPSVEPRAELLLWREESFGLWALGFRIDPCRNGYRIELHFREFLKSFLCMRAKFAWSIR